MSDDLKKRKSNKKMLTGKVVSDKMNKTIVIEIERRKLHTLYKKYVTKRKKIKAHDETNESRIGDIVRVVESKPVSKEKHWRLLDIIERAK